MCSVFLNFSKLITQVLYMHPCNISFKMSRFDTTFSQTPTFFWNKNIQQVEKSSFETAVRYSITCLYASKKLKCIARNVTKCCLSGRFSF